MEYKNLLSDAINMPIDELDAYYRQIQSQAEFLHEILKLRQKHGERTTEQLKRKARRQAREAEKTEKSKPRTAAASKKILGTDIDEVNRFKSTNSGNETPSLTELLRDE